MPPRDRLDRYRAKRDFSVTPEPSGEGTAPTGSRRFVVQRHRARALHYDLRLEMGGVLVSWAVPRGPTLDPAVKRLAVHVEDHPLDYFAFEGVIPGGEYGGGDVIVWDWGTWAPADDADALEEVERGSLHFDLQGEKLAGRFVLVRKGRPSAKEQWLLLHKHDEHAVDGWDPEAHPTSVKTGRTNDEVRDALDAARPRDRHAAGGDAPAATTRPDWVGPTDDELASLDALGKAGRWQFGPHELRLTNLDKVLFPAGPAGPASTKRDLVRHHAQLAPALLPYLADRPVNLHRFPDGVDRPGFWHKAAPAHAPDWITRWRYPDADPGETEVYVVLDSPAALAWAANYGGVELNPWTSTAAHPHEPTWAMIDIDPGTTTTFDEVLVLARLYRTALEHLEVAGVPKVTGQRGVQVWVPVAPGLTFDDTRTWVEALSRAVGRTVPDLVSWQWSKDQRKGLARLDYTQNAVNKTLVAPWSARPAPGGPVSVPIAWDELDEPDLRPDRWTITTALERWRTAGDPLAALVGRHQRLPALS